MQISEQDIREALASELADILHRQKTIIQCNGIIEPQLSETIRDDFRTMSKEDDKNLRMLETAIGNFGLRVAPKNTSRRIADMLFSVVSDDSSLLFEKLGAYNLLKQNQVMCSHLVHKSVQLAKPDIRTALASFDAVYAMFSRHASDLVQFTEKAGVEWMTGRDADNGFLGRARDAVSTLTGAVLSKTAKPADEMDVLKVLKMDHRKVEVLFKEIDSAPDVQQAAQIFRQLRIDLISHSVAEEETVYRRFMHFPNMQGLMQDALHEHEELRSLLDGVSGVLHDKRLFSGKLRQLKEAVDHHVDEEEGKIFDLMKLNSSEEERILLSADFMQAKRRIQENIGYSEIAASSSRPRPPAGDTSTVLNS